MEIVALLSLTVLGIVAVIGILKTKTQGWGKYSTSTLILSLTLVIIAEMLVAGKLEASQSTNLFIAIIGFAGGPIASKIGE